MPPKENLERACEECIHFFVCSRQCGEPMAQRSATGCECYETIKSSMAYYVGTLDGVKGKIPNRLRELAEADKDGRVIVLPAKKGDTLYVVTRFGVEKRVVKEIAAPFFYNTYESSDRAELSTAIRNFGKTVFLTREEAEKALQEMEGKKDGV